MENLGESNLEHLSTGSGTDDVGIITQLPGRSTVGEEKKSSFSDGSLTPIFGLKKSASSQRRELEERFRREVKQWMDMLYHELISDDDHEVETFERSKAVENLDPQLRDSVAEPIPVPPKVFTCEFCKDNEFKTLKECLDHAKECECNPLQDPFLKAGLFELPTNTPKKRRKT